MPSFVFKILSPTGKVLRQYETGLDSPCYAVSNVVLNQDEPEEVKNAAYQSNTNIVEKVV